MADTALIVANNLSHNVSVRLAEAKTSLCHLANVYLVTEVAGQSQATIEAKQRDLQRFLIFSQDLYNITDSRLGTPPAIGGRPNAYEGNAGILRKDVLSTCDRP